MLGLLHGRSLLTLEGYSKQEIRYLLDFSHSLKKEKQEGNRQRRLEEKNIVLIFNKPSTRTRCAFEVAAFDEGARVTVLTNSHLGKKESVEDTAKVLGRYYDGIQYRGSDLKTATLLAKHAGVPVWNGLTDHHHPTQVLADLMTIEEQVNKPLHEIKIIFSGDCRSNVALSLMLGAAKMGMQFTGIAPKSLWPEHATLLKIKSIATYHQGTLDFFDHKEKTQALEAADVIYTDVWFSMGEEGEIASRIELLRDYQVNQEMLAQTNNPNVIFMHCLPAFHDLKTEVMQKVHKETGLTSLEVEDEVFKSKYSVVFDQAENRYHTIKALMIATLT
jgi:ornithine carbamoyltransferase